MWCPHKRVLRSIYRFWPPNYRSVPRSQSTTGTSAMLRRALTRTTAAAQQRPKTTPTSIQSLSTTSSTVTPSPPSNAATGTTKSSWNWLRSFAGFYGDESTAIRHSHSLFNSCHQIGSQKQILQHLVLEDDFFHNHAVINLHVWMVHNRLRAVGPQGKVMQEQIFDRFWEETTKRK